MPKGFPSSLAFIKRALVAVFAMAQLVPAGFAFANDSDEITFVICNGGEPRLATWSEIYGEPSPYQSESDEHSANPCHACFTGACTGGAFNVAAAFLPGLHAPSLAQTIPPEINKASINKTGPPMPSRAPPALI